MPRLPVAALVCTVVVVVATIAAADDDVQQDQVRVLQGQVADLQRQLAEEKQRTFSAEAGVSMMEVADTVKEPPTTPTAGPWKQRTLIVADMNALANWLRAFPYQTALSVTAGCLGLLSIFDSNLFFEGISVTAFAAGACVLATSEASLYWVTLPDWVQWTIRAEVFFISLFAAAVGFKGFQAILGAFIGLLIAHLASDWAMVMAWEPDKGALWYAACAALGTSVLVIGQRQAGAILGPIVGGLMAASCVGFFATDWLASPKEATLPWFDCVDILVSAPASIYDFGQGGDTAARDIGLCFWAVIAFFGMSRWFLGWPPFPCVDEERGWFSQLRTPLLDGDDDYGSKQRLPRGAPPPPPRPPGRR